MYKSNKNELETQIKSNKSVINKSLNKLPTKGKKIMKELLD